MLDDDLNWSQITADIVKRPYITVGMLALTAGHHVDDRHDQAPGRPELEAPAPGRLFRGGVRGLHFLWLAKLGRTDQYLHAAIVALLLGVRRWDAVRRAVHRRRQGALRPASSTPS